jgi:protein disulfide-isomerase
MGAMAGLLAATCVGRAQTGAAPAKAQAVKPAAQWLTNYEEAKKSAAARKLPILLLFTGSDWCPWCMKLDAEVFSKDAFKAYADKAFVLFKADFPRRKMQSPGLTKQNEELARQYGVDGFPTVLVLSTGGEVIAQTGYREGGAEGYVEYLKQLLRGE